jgi:error-prone DNA polymerase
MGWDNPPVPWRELQKRMTWGGGQQAGPDQEDVPDPKPRQYSNPWAELHCHSSYSFLDGASSPAELAEEANRLGLSALAITDHDGMYGVPQFAQAAAKIGLKTVFGAELTLDLPKRQAKDPDPPGRHLLVLARDPDGYRSLCAAISAAQLAGVA